MINIYGEEEFRPIKKYGVEVPYYFVSKDGRVLSAKTSKPKILNPTYASIRKSLNKIQHTKDNHKEFHADCSTCVDTYIESLDKE